MRLEFVMILIREGAVEIYSTAVLTLQGAWSQLKICADQTACPRHARISPEPLLLQRDGQAQGLLLSPNRLRGSRCCTAPPDSPAGLLLFPAAAYSGGRRRPVRVILPFTIKHLWENVTHPSDPHRDFLFFSPSPPLSRELAHPSFLSHFW